ncbi:MAG: family 43 glycosylhydrolase [Burkholderiaceae bacterium]
MKKSRFTDSQIVDALKHVVLGLIFLKYISDAFDEKHKQLMAEDASAAEDRDEYAADNVFWVPKDARWSNLQANAKQPTIGTLIDDAMRAIEKDNESLKGVLPKDYARPALNKIMLGELIDLISKIDLMAGGDHKSKDVLGRVYEYFLGRFAGAEGKGGGEFYTPRSVVRTLVEMLEPYSGRIYDPCCGSGGRTGCGGLMVKARGKAAERRLVRWLGPLALALWMGLGSGLGLWVGPALGQGLPPAGSFRNPVIPGFAPDPSIVRVGPDFYLVTSTFEYFPGIPVYHSRDLVNWSLVGHALDDPRTAGLDDVESSGGIQAATIRHHDGLFYVVTTRILKGQAQSFVVTARDPRGPWSAPAVLRDEQGQLAEGIDPSLFFDDDGRVWYTANRIPPDPQFSGQAEIWLQEFDRATLMLKGPRHALWRGCCQGTWAEAPHLFKKDGRYVLVIAEGGTSYEHAVSVALSRSVTGPYENNPRNPVLTHRHLSLDHPITNVGHADFVELADGRWYAVVLGTRRLGGLHDLLGRETFLVPLQWETEREWWKTDPRTLPVLAPRTGKVEVLEALPFEDRPQRMVPPFRDDFRRPALHPEWTFRRSHPQPFHAVDPQRGRVALKLQPTAIAEGARYSFMGVRQRGFDSTAATRLHFRPQGREEAGLVVIQKDSAAYAFTVALDGKGRRVVQVKWFGEGGPELLSSSPLGVGSGSGSGAGQPVHLRVVVRGLQYAFEHSADGRRWQRVGPPVDGTRLSPSVLRGFNYTGVFLGLYASSNGDATTAVADFEGFELRPLTPARGAPPSATARGPSR